MDKHEPIRDWYRKATRRSLRGLVVATVVAVLASAACFVWLPRDTTLELQVFNGALTIPVFGGIWIASFVLVWLVPMREIGFRGQEQMEKFFEELAPVIRDAKEVVASVRGLVDDIRAQDTRKIVSFIDELTKNGSVERLVRSVEEVGRKVKEVIDRVDSMGGERVASREDAVKGFPGGGEL